ncbi:MAG: GDSL-type esterase/lipase family protein [bacterium]
MSYGANELNDGEFDLAAYAADQDRVVARLRQAAPRADCLITGPPDMLRGGREPPPLADAVYQIQRQVADQHGCAFFDVRAVMGGPGSIRAWRRQGLAGRDFVHLSGRGYALLGEALLGALLAAHERR